MALCFACLSLMVIKKDITLIYVAVVLPSMLERFLKDYAKFIYPCSLIGCIETYVDVDSMNGRTETVSANILRY